LASPATMLGEDRHMHSNLRAVHVLWLAGGIIASASEAVDHSLGSNTRTKPKGYEGPKRLWRYFNNTAS
jgi:hypothetical protein